MVSSGKHSRGNWVLASSALLVSSELPAGPERRGEEAPAQDAHEGVEGIGRPPGLTSDLTLEKTTTKMDQDGHRAEHRPQDPERGLLVLGPEVAFGQGVDDLAVGPQRPDRLDEPDLVAVEDARQAARRGPTRRRSPTSASTSAWNPVLSSADTTPLGP